MTIHHTHIKKAEKAGYILKEIDDGVEAFWPKRALTITGSSSSDAMQQMQAAMALLSNDEFRIIPDVSQPRLVTLTHFDYMVKGCPMTPFEIHQLVTKEQHEWVPALVNTNGEPQLVEADDTPVERINGIATDGAVAYREGTPSADCPYSSEDEEDEGEYENFLRWNEEWDNAADEATDEEGSKGGSVVGEKYRARYAEAGHPTHCGDWLAELLNNLCLTKKDTDLDRFEAICAANGVDTSKYRRSGVGWQGRIRMTGRNLLAKKVYLAGGIILTPVEGAEPQYKAPAEWMATQRFKMPKSEQNKPMPVADEPEAA